MNLFRTILLAGGASLVAGLILTIVNSVALPCYSDKPGCVMEPGFRLFLVPFEVVFVMLIFGVTAGKGQRAAKMVMLIMAGLTTAVLLLGWFSEAMSGGFTRKGIVETWQMLSVVILVIVVQWLVIRARLNRQPASSPDAPQT